MSTVLDYEDLTPIQIPVKYRGKVYLLCEANGEAGTRYRNAVYASLRATEGGETLGLQGYASVQPLLVHLCLYESEEVPGSGEYRLKLDQEKNPIRVSEEIVNSFPSRMLLQLFEKAKEISELGEFGDTIDDMRRKRDRLNKRIATLEKEEESAKNE